MSDVVRDYTKDPVVVRAVEEARDTIITCWGDWEADAGQDAQREQDNEAWFDAMNAQLEAVLYGMLDQLPDVRTRETAEAAGPDDDPDIDGDADDKATDDWVDPDLGD